MSTSRRVVGERSRARSGASAAAPRRSPRRWRRPTTTCCSSSTRARSSARRSAACGSACSSTAWTSDPKVAPAGRPSIGEGRSAPSSTSERRPSGGACRAVLVAVLPRRRSPRPRARCRRRGWRPAPRRGSGRSRTCAARPCRRLGRRRGRRAARAVGRSTRVCRRRRWEISTTRPPCSLPLLQLGEHLEVGRAAGAPCPAQPPRRRCDRRAAALSPACPASQLGANQVTTCDWARVSAT